MSNYLCSRYIFILYLYVILPVSVTSESRNALNEKLRHIKPRATPDIQAVAVQDLITRIIPKRASKFVVSIDGDLSDDKYKDAFRIEKETTGDIHITATTGVAAAAGFNHYIKYFCNCQVAWEVSQLNLPEELPDVNITVTFNDRFRYYQNVCTTSYNFVWWDWSQWEKHIDWMALNAFNLVLAFSGQEAIWERVYQKFNLTATDIEEHFTGPAFLSWLRMGNIRGFAGPLSKAWQARTLSLQKLILKRMRDFGMIPVLPAFAGHLPRAFKRLYPNATMEKLDSWNGFNDTYCCPYFLDPTEKLFQDIGAAFITEQISEYGSDHVYNCDTFNEMNPVSGELHYLSNIGTSVYRAMANADPKAVWLMQNWMFVNEASFWTKDRVKSMLTAVPVGKMIILDLMSEHRPQYEIQEQYFGQPYIWCMLHNFGDTSGMFGSSSIINEEPVKARNMENSTMIGTGLTMEGINQNYVIYELMTETAWRNTSTNLTAWIEEYTIRRYGVSDENIKSAWRILQKTIYDYKDDPIIMGQYLVVKSPSYDYTTMIWYADTDLYYAWSKFLMASSNLHNNSAYLYDLVDITRQVFQVAGDTFYNSFLAAYTIHNIELFNQSSQIFLDILFDMEDILSTNEGFLLGRWINSAKKAANSSEEEKQFEYNARNQITLWGPGGEIKDYAIKQWSGIISNYCIPRWKMFFNYTMDILMSGQTFDQGYISDKIFSEVEQPFTFDRSEFPDKPTGHPVAIARAAYKKWFSFLKNLSSSEKEVILVR